MRFAQTMYRFCICGTREMEKLVEEVSFIILDFLGNHTVHENA
jgi:hypothetical protein